LPERADHHPKVARIYHLRDICVFRGPDVPDDDGVDNGGEQVDGVSALLLPAATLGRVFLGWENTLATTTMAIPAEVCPISVHTPKRQPIAAFGVLSDSQGIRDWEPPHHQSRGVLAD
jgi:hypothetical protein